MSGQDIREGSIPRLTGQGRWIQSAKPNGMDCPLTGETHGFAQHMICYATYAAHQVQEDGGEMTPKGLDRVLKEGRDAREEYYHWACGDLTAGASRALGTLYASASAEQRLPKKDILEALSKDYGKEEAEKRFYSALRSRTLYERDNTCGILIPSLRDWIVEKFVPEHG